MTDNTPLMLLPPEKGSEVLKLGPAMLALDAQKRRFVEAVMELGIIRDFGEAARRAGYEGSADYLKRKGYRLSHEEDVQRAFAEESRKRLTAHAPLATTVLVNLIEAKATEDKVKLKAIEMLYNRIGMHEMREEKKVVEVHHIDDNELKRQAKLLITDMGLGPEEARKLLGDHYEEIMEGEFTEITPQGVPKVQVTWMTEEEQAERMLEEAMK